MEDKISVIIPVYNVERFLKECVESVLNQSYSNFEIILVDDGSTDNSGVICDDFAKLDSRIIVVHKKNGGLSDARNIGLSYATGLYITFIDSDDSVDHLYLELLLGLICKYDADVSACREYSVTSNKNEQESVAVFTPFLAIESMLLEQYITPSACGKLYRLEFFKDISFPVGMLFEDFATTYKIFFKSRKIVQTNKKLYYYRPNPKGIMRSDFSEKYMDILTVHEMMIDFLNREIPELVNIAKARKARFSFLMLIKYSTSRCCQNKYKKVLMAEMRSNFKYFIRSNYRMKEKLLYILYLLNYRIASVFLLKLRR